MNVPGHFEDELRAALRREPAPPDFARKLKKRLPVSMWKRPLTWALAAGLLVGVAIPPAVVEYRAERQARAAEASRQLLVALRITGVKLRQTRERIQRTTLHATKHAI